jgi:hypothetical protein
MLNTTHNAHHKFLPHHYLHQTITHIHRNKKTEKTINYPLPCHLLLSITWILFHPIGLHFIKDLTPPHFILQYEFYTRWCFLFGGFSLKDQNMKEENIDMNQTYMNCPFNFISIIKLYGKPLCIQS